MTFLRTSVRRDEILSRDREERSSAHSPLLVGTRLHKRGTADWAVEFTYSDGTSMISEGSGARGVPALA